MEWEWYSLKRLEKLSLSLKVSRFSSKNSLKMMLRKLIKLSRIKLKGLKLRKFKLMMKNLRLKSQNRSNMKKKLLMKLRLLLYLMVSSS